MNNDLQSFINQSSNVKPSERQLAWFDTEFYAFIHFGVNTFTNKEWGDGNEPESIFNPKKLDCNQWVENVKKAGMKGIILTAKHHDGFCLWPSIYTEHCVKNAPCKRNVVKECAEACKKGGIKFGFYLSPWDRNSKLYGTDEYNDYFCNQLTELLTGYGDIFCVWFDNACGEGENGKKQVYDFDRYISLVRKYQPDAVIFNDFGPDVRWCGNEAGQKRDAEWSVVPVELCKYSEIQTEKGPLFSEGKLNFLYNNNAHLGDLSKNIYSKGLTFTPSEIDMSIRPGWFHHPNEEPWSLEKLFITYVNSVGHNACLNLNIPPDKGGLISDYDSKRLSEFGELLSREFEKADFEYENIQLENNCAIFEFDSEVEIKYIVLEEDIKQGQRIESFQFENVTEDGYKNPVYTGHTIGHKEICVFQEPFNHENNLNGGQRNRFKNLKLRVTGSRGEALIESVKIYKSGKSFNDEGNENQISELKDYAHVNDVPIMKDEGSEFICNYIREHNIKSILEIGTAIGYSSIKFANQADDVFVSSIEIDIDRYKQAVKNVNDAKLDDRITLYLADATTLELTDKFDMIFIDGPKAQYIPLFEKYKNNLTENGVIISDNLSFHGMVEDLSLTHNYSTIKLVKKIRKYIDFLKANEEFETEFFKLGDGVSVSKRIK